MKVLVSGSNGMVGSALVPYLQTKGLAVRRLVRSGGDASDATWDPAAGALDVRHFDGVDAVVHLAGESIGDGRWKAEKKARILESRVQGTGLIATTLARAALRPKTLLVASAVGYYGDRGDDWVDETSRLGSGFLADVCRAWEVATRPALDAGVRVVNLRFGFILSPKGGGLRRMLTPFRLGLGGPIGGGRQWMSWIALDDVVAAIAHALANEVLRGPVNVVAPNPVTNAEFTKELARLLHRPAIVPMPAFAARAAFGEMADELLLSSQRVRPTTLVATGFVFGFPTLDRALRHLLTEEPAPPNAPAPPHASSK